MKDLVRLEEAKKLFYPNDYCKSHNTYKCDSCAKELKKNIEVKQKTGESDDRQLS